jgi:fructokinase
MSPSATVVCIGEILWDVLPAGRQPGGAPFNVAVHLHQLGQPVQLISRVGDDELGRELLDFCAQRGVGTELIQRSQTHLTGVVKATVHSNQEVSYKIVEPVAWDYLQYNSEVCTAVSQAAMVVYGSLAARSTTSRETLYRLLLLAPFKVFAVNLRPPYCTRAVVKYLLRQADLVVLTSQELVEIMNWLGQPASEAVALPWLAGHFGLKGVCVNKGAAGATLWLADQFFNSPGFAVTVQDTIGSNDAFLAALLVGFRQGHPPADYLRHACAAGALVAQQSGATPSLAEQDILNLMRA